jgi:CubicO group peptidase (beta-lactamase class C family)
MEDERMKNKKGVKILYTLGLTAFLLIQSVSHGAAYANIEQDSLAVSSNIINYIDEEMNQLVENKLAKGITVAIVQDHELVFSKGYGYADEKNGIKVNPEATIFKIGSVSKIFVAMAAMQLQEQGKLDMSAPISQYLEEDFPNFDYPITMENLLTHTAGFEDLYSPLEVALEEDILPLGEYVRKYMPKQVFQPGEVSAYSNYGISLAGYIIERISGMHFYEYAEENIFTPLQMMHTTYLPAPKGELSKAYSPKGEEKADVLEHSYPAGSVSSTAEDMARYMAFLLDESNQTILGSNGKLDMFNKHFAMDKELPGYGYVWKRHEFNDHLFYEHGGGTANFTSQLALYPEQRLGIFMSSNQINSYELAEYSFVVAEMLYGKEQQREEYTGRNARDISGYYIPARSVFKGSDKFVGNLLNLFCGFPKHITGNPTDGFKMDGKRLIAVGEDTYSLEGNPEIVKFIQKGDRLYYTPKNYYTSCVRVPWYEGALWQLFVIMSFIILSLVGFLVAVIRSIVSLIKRRGNYQLLINIPYITVFLLFVLMIVRFIVYMGYMNRVFGDLNCTAGLEDVIAFYRIAASGIAFFGLGGIASTLCLWLKKNNMAIRIFYSVWSTSVILFIIWLVQLNLIS